MSRWRDRGAKALFWCAAAGVAWCAFTPGPSRFPGGDKADHIAAFLVLTVLGGLAYPKLNRLALAALLMLSGGAIELAQALPFSQHTADLNDLVADAIGVITGIAVILVLSLFSRRPKGPAT